MNNNQPFNQLSTLSTCALVAAFLLMSAAASAQAVDTSASQGDITPGHASAVSRVLHDDTKPHFDLTQDALKTENEEEVFDLPYEVGNATANLFAWQRGGEIASATTRPIAGPIASRSYERYLKSFEHPIPEQFGSSVSKNGGAPQNAGAR